MTTRESAVMFVEAATRESSRTGQTVREVLTAWHAEHAAAREHRFLEAYELALASVSPATPTVPRTAPATPTVARSASAADRAYDLALAESQAADRARHAARMAAWKLAK